MDRHLQRFALPDGQALSPAIAAEPIQATEEQIMQVIAINNGAAKGQTQEVIHEPSDFEWTHLMSVALVLDCITITCIVWLLFR